VIAGALWTDPLGRLWFFFDQVMNHWDRCALPRTAATVCGLRSARIPTPHSPSGQNHAASGTAGYQMKERGEPHPDWILLDGTLDESLRGA
jgi:hypothetical protein